MNNALSKTADKQRKSRLMANPFVCEYQPSVCSRNPINEPFVGKNIPNRRLKLAMRRIHAFTLVELVVTIAVAAILITVAVPNFHTFVQNTRIITQVNNLKTDLAKARNKSIGSPYGIGVCRSTNGTSCTGGQWTDGYLTFVDLNNNRQWDAGELVLQFREALAAGSTLTATPAIPDPLIFFQGMISNLGAGAAFIFCDSRGPTNGKQINVLTATGLATVDVNAPSACN